MCCFFFSVPISDSRAHVEFTYLVTFVFLNMWHSLSLSFKNLTLAKSTSQYFMYIPQTQFCFQSRPLILAFITGSHMQNMLQWCTFIKWILIETKIKLYYTVIILFSLFFYQLEFFSEKGFLLYLVIWVLVISIWAPDIYFYFLGRNLILALSICLVTFFFYPTWPLGTLSGWFLCSIDLLCSIILF